MVVIALFLVTAFTGCVAFFGDNARYDHYDTVNQKEGSNKVNRVEFDISP